MKFTIQIDTREQRPWAFASSDICNGSLVKKMKTGDYCLLGEPEGLVIERKARISELAMNLVQARFDKEMTRMAQAAVPIVMTEFPFSDILEWPVSGGLSADKLEMVRTSGPFLASAIFRLQLAYPWVHFIFASVHARRMTLSLLQRAHGNYPSRNHAKGFVLRELQHPSELSEYQTGDCVPSLVAMKFTVDDLIDINGLPPLLDRIASGDPSRFLFLGPCPEKIMESLRKRLRMARHV